MIGRASEFLDLGHYSDDASLESSMTNLVRENKDIC